MNIKVLVATIYKKIVEYKQLGTAPVLQRDLYLVLSRYRDVPRTKLYDFVTGYCMHARGIRARNWSYQDKIIYAHSTLPWFIAYIEGTKYIELE